MAGINIVFIGRSQKANTFCARYLTYKYKFRFLGMDDEMEAFLRKTYSYPRYRRNFYFPWERRLAFYDAWQKVDPTIWAQRIVKRASLLETYNSVTPDCRYLEEVKVLEAAGFIFIRINDKPKQIKNLRTANMGALAYYEWFAKDADVYVRARYSINMNVNDLKSREATRKSLDRIYIELTEENTVS